MMTKTTRQTMTRPKRVTENGWFRTGSTLRVGVWIHFMWGRKGRADDSDQKLDTRHLRRQDEELLVWEMF